MINIFSVRPKGFNIGNDVIYIGVNHFIRKAFKKNYNIISIPCTSKYESHRKAGLSSQTVYEINQYGHGVVIGGGNLYENGELEVNPVALAALERPLMIMSVSRGRIYNKSGVLVDRTDVMTDDRISLINRRANVSLSRDKATADYIRSLGCQTELGGCPTLFINEIPQHLVPILEADSSDALISIRSPHLMSIPVSLQYEMREQLSDLLVLLKENGYQNIKILCHDHRDIPFAASFRNIDYVYTEDVYTYLTYIKNTRLNISYRLHSFIPCLSLGVPAIKICYDQRALSMMDTLGMTQWKIDYVHDDVLREVRHRLANIDELKGIVNKLQTTRWAELKQTMEEGCSRFAELVQQHK